MSATLRGRDPNARERAAAGEIESFAPSFVVDTETVVAADPDVYITGGFPVPEHEAIATPGSRWWPNAEWLETTPGGMGRVGRGLRRPDEHRGRGERAVRRVDRRLRRRRRTRRRGTERPTVITGGLFEGTWFANGGASIVAEFIADAGGNYVYDDDPSTGSIELDIETVLAEAATADVWLLATRSPPRKKPSRRRAARPSSTPGMEGGVWINQRASDPTINSSSRGR